ncbi:MAG: hypothetical protein ACI9FB_003830 [Candidatus Azotimanducaceae bacterium]|jgi:hypothetical protein
MSSNILDLRDIMTEQFLNNFTPLTSEELSFFKQYGYLIKRQAISISGCKRALDRMWETAPEGIKRDDPSTWKSISESAEFDDSLLVKKGTRWQLRSSSTEAEIIELAYNRQVCAWAEQLLGEGTLKAPKIDGEPMGSWGPAWPGGPVDPAKGDGVRGIYATLPWDQSNPVPRDNLHTDGHPFHLGAVCLLEDNPPGGGGFKVWPTSHKRFYPLFPMQYDQARIPFYEHMPTFKGINHPPEYLSEVNQVESDTSPVDCHGEAGDLVFWHHRMGHMAGINTSEPPCIRQALLYDFSKSDLDTMRLAPPHEDMWLDWGPELQNANEPVTRQLAAEQRLPLTLAEQLD